MTTMIMRPLTQRRCGSPVTEAACCPGSRTQDGPAIPNPPSLLAEAGRLGPAATPLMESGGSPTLCLRSGLAMCPGRVQLGYSSWEVGTPALTTIQSCSPPPLTLLLLASVCHIRHCNDCVASHCKYLYCYHLHIQLGLCHWTPGPGRGDWRPDVSGLQWAHCNHCPCVHHLWCPGAAPWHDDS